MITKLTLPIVIALASVGFLAAQDKPDQRTRVGKGLTSRSASTTAGSPENTTGALPSSELPSRLSGTSFFTSNSGGTFWANRQQSKADRQLQSRIQSATRKLKEATDADATEDAETELGKALGEDYDARLDEYEQQLDRMEKQLAAMRKKLARRREAKGDMVKLRLKVLKAEADELGWPGKTRSSSLPGLFSRETGSANFPEYRFGTESAPNSTSKRPQ